MMREVNAGRDPTWLQDLAAYGLDKDDPDGVFRRVHGFVVIAFIAASRRLRGANGAPLRSLDIAVGE